MKRVTFFLESGLSSRYWSSAIPEVASHGWEVNLITLRGRGPLNVALEELGIETKALGCSNAIGYIKASKAVAAVVDEWKSDVLHACEIIQAAIGGTSRLWGARRALRLFHRQHTLVRGKQLTLSRLGSRFADVTLACSASAKRCAIEQDHVDEERAFVAPNATPELRAVAADEAMALRGRLGIGHDQFVVVHVARLRPEKGHRTLIDAMAGFERQTGKPAHLVIVGSGPEEQPLRQYAQRARHVHFVGHQEDVAPWFAMASVAALPSYSEPFGISAVEAMAAKRPLVASAVEGLLEVVEDGRSGLLVPPGDEDALADALARLCRSPSFAAEMATGGYRRFASSFTIERMVSQWVSCYEACLTGSRDVIA